MGKLAFRTKISRERVGEELDKMMKGMKIQVIHWPTLITDHRSFVGKNPLLSIQMINDLSMSSSVFLIPPSVAALLSASPAPPVEGLVSASILDGLIRPTLKTLPQLHPILVSAFTHDLSTPPRLYLACALSPWRHVMYKDAKGRPHAAVEVVLREGLKLGIQSHYLDGIPALFAAADLLHNPQIGGEKERVRMGKQSSIALPPHKELKSQHLKGCCYAKGLCTT